MEGASNKMQNVLSDLEERHNDILKLEKVYINKKECQHSPSNVSSNCGFDKSSR
jgi:hypothetical protein